jgi:hypothetical protein
VPSDISVNDDIDVFEDDADEYDKQWKRALKRSKERLEKVQSKQKRLYDKGSKLVKYNANDHVLLKAHSTPGKFNNRWLGPYKINRKISDLNYEIIKITDEINNTEDEGKYIVHVNRLKLVTSTPNNITSPNPIIIKKRRKTIKKIQTKVGKKRGRPPKVKEVVTATKRRGRPPKITGVVIPPQPKRGGRPPNQPRVTDQELPNNNPVIPQTQIRVSHRYPLRNRN